MSWKFRFAALIVLGEKGIALTASSLSPWEQSAAVQAGGSILLKIYLFLKVLKCFQITEPTILLKMAFLNKVGSLKSDTICCKFFRKLKA